MTPPKTNPKNNGVVPAATRFTLSVDGLQMQIIHQFCTQAQLPTVELKRAVAALQEQIESLAPQDT